MELSSPAGDLMVIGGRAGPSLPPAKPVVRAPILPAAGLFLTTPIAPGPPSLVASILRFFGLPVNLTELSR
eukprot:6497376-Lingulodinium_polyedra.AAC.1